MYSCICHHRPMCLSDGLHFLSSAFQSGPNRGWQARRIQNYWNYSHWFYCFLQSVKSNTLDFKRNSWGPLYSWGFLLDLCLSKVFEEDPKLSEEMLALPVKFSWGFVSISCLSWWSPLFLQGCGFHLEVITALFLSASYGSMLLLLQGDWTWFFSSSKYIVSFYPWLLFFVVHWWRRSLWAVFPSLCWDFFVSSVFSFLA